ncbi:MAG: PAS domain S-box protein [Desulfurella sp.]|uniref:PAS domain S-box protein n=1 Tax=Desulfurella sp. TaxID=1962857 RepID=UPI003D135279
MKQEDFSFKTLQAITDNLYIGIYVTDGSGKAIYINKTFEDISLLKKEDLLGHDINELVKKNILLHLLLYLRSTQNNPLL